MGLNFHEKLENSVFISRIRQVSNTYTVGCGIYIFMKAKFLAKFVKILYYTYLSYNQVTPSYTIFKSCDDQLWILKQVDLSVMQTSYILKLLNWLIENIL